MRPESICFASDYPLAFFALAFAGLGFFFALGVKGLGGVFSSRSSVASSRDRGFGMRADLLDAKTTLDWAVAQIGTLTERIIAWKRTKPYGTVTEADADPAYE